jgi:hypothetical protein
MHAHLTTRRTSLDASANALVRRRHSLDAEINDELKQSVPGHLQLGQLKLSKQRLKDKNSEIEGVGTTVHRAWVER